MRNQLEADYVVVGAGSAGCVLANRLSADPANRVVLIEAGGSDWNPLIRVPLLTRILFSSRALNWNYETAQEPGLADRVLKWPRGKVLGGTSSINGMTYIRGHARDFDDWQRAGCRGWSYEDVLPYFRRSETNPKGPPYHGTDGELSVGQSGVPHPLEEPFMAACGALGLDPTDDFNGARQEGYGRHDFTIRDGRRHSSSDAFLRPVLGRSNLTLMTRARAERIKVEGGRAVAVDGLRVGRPFSLKARKEVVLCGGTINSPQLLMLSGIGPDQHLRSHGIPTKVDLPGVGRNLQDHLGVYIAQACLRPVTLRGELQYHRAALSVIRALLFHSGPATAIPISACGFFRTSPHLETPDVQVTLLPGLVTGNPWRPPRAEGFILNAYQLRPRSRGHLMLRGADPNQKPIIHANYLSDGYDRIVLRNAVRLVRAIIAQRSFDELRGEELSPGPSVTDDDAIDRWIARNAGTFFHPVGTCRMGTDSETVVDDQLRVRGVEGLRVADASVMPTIVGGNTNAAAMMIAEKAADIMQGTSGREISESALV